MLRLAAGMAAEGISVELLLIQQKGEYLDDVPNTIPVHCLDSKSVTSALLPLARYICKRKPSSILAALTHVNVVAILSARLARFKGPVIVSERNHVSSKARDAKGLRDRLSYKLVRYVYPLATKVVAVSKGVAADLKAFSKLSDALVTYIYNPVFDQNLARLTRERPSHAWLRDHIVPVVVAFGRLHPQKDFPMLIRAFDIARSRVSARLIIFGEGQERASLQALIDQSTYPGDIDLAGFTGRPLAEMAAADLLALSSRWEGFPNVLVEGLASGLRIVATNCPSGPEEILDGGRYGCLVPVGDAEAMANGIVQSVLTPPDREAFQKRAAVVSVQTAVALYAKLLNIRVDVLPSVLNSGSYESA